MKIQVMPFTTGVAAGGAITLPRFAGPGIAGIVYLDQFAGALYPDKPADVQHYGQVMDRLCTRAEPPGSSRRYDVMIARGAVIISWRCRDWRSAGLLAE